MAATSWINLSTLMWHLNRLQGQQQGTVFLRDYCQVGSHEHLPRDHNVIKSHKRR